MQAEPFADILDENETLLWMDKPNRRAWMINGYICLVIGIAFTAVITIPMLVGFATGPGSKTMHGLLIFFAFFYGAPGWFSIGYLFWLHRAEKKTVYAYSDKRVLIQRGGFGVSYTTIAYEDIRYVTVRVGWFESQRGTGSLFLETGVFQPSCCGLDQWSHKRFVGIEKPYEVAKMINAQIQAAKKSATN